MQPPSDGPLVTCLTCGLAYPPKERLRSSKSRAKPDALALVQPPGLAVRTRGHELAYLWSEADYSPTFVVAATSLLAFFIWVSGMALLDKLRYTGFIVALDLFAAAYARKRPRVRVDRNKLYGTSRALLLVDIRRIDADCGRLVATDRYDKSHEIAEASDHAIATFIADDLARRLGISE